MSSVQPPRQSAAPSAHSSGSPAAPRHHPMPPEPAIRSFPPITHAVGGSLGSAFALLLLYPLERVRIEMQAVAARGNSSRNNAGAAAGRSSSSTPASSDPPLVARSAPRSSLQEQQRQEDGRTLIVGAAGSSSSSSDDEEKRERAEADVGAGGGNAAAAATASSPSSTATGGDDSWTTARLSQSGDDVLMSSMEGEEAAGGDRTSGAATGTGADTGVVAGSREMQQIQQQQEEKPDDAAASGTPSPVAGSNEARGRSAGDDGLSLVGCFQGLCARNELYRGVGPIVSTLATSNFVFFYVNALMKRLVANGKKDSMINPQTSAYWSLLASCLAGVINVLLTNPMWVANLRIVTGDANSSSNSVWREMMVIARERGIGHLWTGTSTSIMLVSNPVIQFFTYEQIRTAILSSRIRKGLSANGSSNAEAGVNLSPLEAFVAGAVAKAIATVLTYPLQLAQAVLRLQDATGTENEGVDDEEEEGSFRGSRRRKQDGAVDRPYRGTLDCLTKLYHHDGLAGLFTGMRAKLLQTVLTAAFTFLTYEQILHAVHAAHTSLLRKRSTRTGTVS